MKIQIKSLHVVDCGPIKDAIFDFADENGVPRDTTLMTGANGSGKTTILRLIVALAQSIRNRADALQGLLGQTRYASMDLVVDGESITIVSGKDIIGKKSSDIYSSQPAHAWKIYSDLEERIAAQSKQASLHAFIPSGSVFKEFSDRVPSILFFPHHRELPDIDGHRIEKEDVAYQWVYEYKASSKYLGSLNSYLIWLDYAHPGQFLAALSVMNSLYSDGKMFEIDRPRLKVIVRTRDGGVHDLEELSSGEQNILITLIELRRRLIPGSIVLIDEIENSLHKDYQFRFGFTLQALQKEVPFQLIATSHANTFSRIFGYENLLILPAPGTHGRQRQAPIK